MNTDPATAAWTETMAQRTVGSLCADDIGKTVTIPGDVTFTHEAYTCPIDAVWHDGGGGEPVTTTIGFASGAELVCRPDTPCVVTP